ncbi:MULTISPECIES: hypothetical protein [Clostridium]|uniref:Uncharacterized protein n=1 Tax=Clostridium aquiflavi TaxID=3073603 RepID=A0ABU1EHU7_9CLOT|nr:MULTISPECIES: hypothetical protein [unclassified Clostridium]MDR5587930.1 hypothetical protein [Clostridium sp. 5N-1]NFG61046.1 hypothetical protein [Clostridium botulinum]NFQ09369.1 hypothetical protein [Clostridium botulinum]
MDQLTKVLTQIDFIVLGVPLLVLLMETRICLTVRLGLIQLLKLSLSLKFLFEKSEKEHNVEGDVTSFATLCTVLAATISCSYAL